MNICPKSLVPWLAAGLLLLPLAAPAADLTVRLENAPESGNLVFQVYDAADAFGDLRDPAKEIVLPARGDGEYELPDVSNGRIAVLVYYDKNGNGLIDKNFIGIPRESLALSNDYQPKGPPSFARASFDLDAELVIRGAVQRFSDRFHAMEANGPLDGLI